MNRLLDGLRAIVDPSRIKEDPLELAESGKGNKCGPIPVLSPYRGNFWALRLTDEDYSRVLAGLKQDEARSFRKLPDYLIFAEPNERRRKRDRTNLHIFICELKSSDAGAASGKRQVQLGKFFAEYLVRVASFANGDVKTARELDIRGVIASPTYLPQLRTKGTTRADEDDGAAIFDSDSDMWIHHVACRRGPAPGGSLRLSYSAARQHRTPVE